MCQNASDSLNILLLMKVTGMLEASKGRITKCPFDVTGLCETIDDLVHAPRIVRELLCLDPIREYIIKLRDCKLTVMLGYSDSVRDGSSFTSDSQITTTSFELKKLEEELNFNAIRSERVGFFEIFFELIFE